MQPNTRYAAVLALSAALAGCAQSAADTGELLPLAVDTPTGAVFAGTYDATLGNIALTDAARNGFAPSAGAMRIDGSPVDELGHAAVQAGLAEGDVLYLEMSPELGHTIEIRGAEWVHTLDEAEAATALPDEDAIRHSCSGGRIAVCRARRIGRGRGYYYGGYCYPDRQSCSARAIAYCWCESDFDDE